MALTGNYDVAIEIGMGMVNAVLGAVHENQDPRYPPMLHSLNIYVDDTHRGPGDPVPEQQRTGVRSRMEVQVSTPIVSLPVPVIGVRPDIATMAARVPASRLPGDIVVWPGFREKRVQTTVRVRAWVRDAAAAGLPEFVAGDLFVTAGLVRADVAGVGTFLTVDRTSGPLVAFQPSAATPLDDAQRQKVASIVANLIRSDMEPPTFRVALPGDVRHFEFLLHPGARRPSASLLLMLTDRQPGPGATTGVQGGLLPDGADFAVAIGRDFALDMLASNLAQGFGGSFSYSKWGVSASVRPDWGGASFELEPGRFVFTVTGDGNISWWGVDDHFTFTVRLSFGLQLVGGRLQPVALGDPEVDFDDVAVGGGYLEDKAKDSIRKARDQALAAGAAQLGQRLDLSGQLSAILAAISPKPAGVVLTGVDVRADGIVVSGRVGLAATAPVVVARASRGGYDDALESWIPGGTIDRIVWQNFPSSPPLTRVEEHRFVTEPIATRPFGRVCVTVEGTRVTPGGGRAPVSGTACFWTIPMLGPLEGLTAEIGRPLVPLTEPDDDGVLQVVGHYDPWASGRVPAKGHANLLVHFTTERADDARRLGEAVAHACGEVEAPVVAVAVLPPGGLAAASKAGAPDDVVLVEDGDGAWAAALGAEGRPASVLVGPRGAVVWRDTSEITADVLRKVLAEHGHRGGEVASQVVRLAVRVGDRVPDVPLGLDDGAELSLRRLRGRPVALTFWTTRSAPSLDQLDVLRDLHAGADRAAPLVLAVGDGETADRAARVAEERRLPFTVVGDPDRRLARAFGVWCWPTTLWVRPDLRVEAVDFGGSAPRRDRATAT